MKKYILPSALLVMALSFIALELTAQPRPIPRNGSRGYSRGYYNQPYRGQRIVSFHSSPYIVPYRGINYRYQSGYFYRPYGNYFQVMAPPIGIRINILPSGYRQFNIGNNPYYYYNNTYYKPYANNTYEVVDAPMGASLPSLPTNSKAVVINGQKYFENEGTYYQEEIRNNNEMWYVVVGKNGVLDTPEVDEQPADIQIGDVVDSLPSDCKSVTLSGKTYYVSTDNVYYQEQLINNQVSYKVVGK